jgi:hypothetical protein
VETKVAISLMAQATVVFVLWPQPSAWPWSNKRGPIIASKERKKKDGEGQRFGYFWFFFTAPFKKFSHLLKIISSTWLSIVWRSWYILLWESIIEFFDFAVYIYICDIPYMKFRQLRCRNCMPHQETMGCKLCAYDTWKCLQDLYAIKYYAVQYCKWTIASGFFFWIVQLYCTMSRPK